MRDTSSTWRSERLFAAMGLTGVFVYQFLENCAIYYTNASNSDALTWLNLGFLGLLASAACFVMWNYACREIGVVRTTVGLYLTPIVGVVFAAVFLGERLTQMSLLGGGFIVVGVAIANWRWRR